MGPAPSAVPSTVPLQPKGPRCTARSTSSTQPRPTAPAVRPPRATAAPRRSGARSARSARGSRPAALQRPASPAALPRERNPPLSVAHTPRPCAAGDRPPPARAPHAAGREPHAAPALPRRAPLWGFPHLSAARRSATMTDVTRRMTSPVFVGRDDGARGARRRARPRRRRRAGVRVHRRRVGRRQDAGCSPSSSHARVRAAMRVLRRPLPRAGRRPDPLRAARRRAAPDRARPRRAPRPSPARGHAQRARRAAAGARRHRHAPGRRARARRQAPPVRGAARRCSTGSAARAGRCSCSRTCTGPTPSTRDFLTFLVRSAREEPLCLVVTYRSDELHRRHPLRPLLAELERASGVERIGLERFSRDEVAAQLDGHPRRRAGRRARRPPVRRARQGNPLYTEELLAATRGRRQLAAARDAARRAARARRAALPGRPGGRARSPPVVDRPSHARAARGGQPTCRRPS